MKIQKASLVVGISLASALASIAPMALAAVDSDVASTSASVVTTFKENIIGVISANIANIVIVGSVMLGVTLVWRLAKRFLGGR